MVKADLLPSGVKDVPQGAFVIALAAFFKKSGKFQLMNNHDIIKTAKYKENAPVDEDWYYTRAAALARKLYWKGCLSPYQFARLYSGRQRGRSAVPRRSMGSKNLARHIMHNLAKLKIVKKVDGGRILTPRGRQDMDRIASAIRSRAKAKN